MYLRGPGAAGGICRELGVRRSRPGFAIYFQGHQSFGELGRSNQCRRKTLTNLLLPRLQSNVIDHWSFFRPLLLFDKKISFENTLVLMVDWKPSVDRGAAAHWTSACVPWTLCRRCGSPAYRNIRIRKTKPLRKFTFKYVKGFLYIFDAWIDWE